MKKIFSGLKNFLRKQCDSYCEKSRLSMRTPDLFLVPIWGVAASLMFMVGAEYMFLVNFHVPMCTASFLSMYISLMLNLIMSECMGLRKDGFLPSLLWSVCTIGLVTLCGWLTNCCLSSEAVIGYTWAIAIYTMVSRYAKFINVTMTAIALAEKKYFEFKSKRKVREARVKFCSEIQNILSRLPSIKIGDYSIIDYYDSDEDIGYRMENQNRVRTFVARREANRLPYVAI